MIFHILCLEIEYFLYPHEILLLVLGVVVGVCLGEGKIKVYFKSLDTEYRAPTKNYANPLEEWKAPKFHETLPSSWRKCI